jgi:hypothetical protein
MDNRARKIHAQPDPANAGTKHLRNLKQGLNFLARSKSLPDQNVKH